MYHTNSGFFFYHRERVRRLEKASQQIESENKTISIIVLSLVGLADVIWMEQILATRNGALGAPREEESVNPDNSSPPVSPYPRVEECKDFASMGLPKPREKERRVGQRMRFWGRENEFGASMLLRDQILIIGILC